jgi:hypothetical protein
METLALVSPIFSKDLPMLNRAKQENAAMMAAARVLLNSKSWNSEREMKEC